MQEENIQFSHANKVKGKLSSTKTKLSVRIIFLDFLMEVLFFFGSELVKSQASKDA